MNDKLIIIPAYNEEKNIAKVLNNLAKYSGYDVLVVNDCSTDSTAVICEKIAAQNTNMHLVNLPFNMGIGGAVQTGYIFARRHNYKIAIQFDGDGQHLPEYLDVLVRPIEAGEANFTIGSRYLKKEGFQSTWLRRVGIGYFAFLCKLLTGRRILDMTSGFRAADERVIALFARDYPADYPEPETNVELAKLDYKVAEVAVQMAERAGGQSSIRGLKSAWYMLKVTLAILIRVMRTK